MTIIKHMIERGLPFELKEYWISYYKLPSVGSHWAVHFLWKNWINDSADCPDQLKAIHDLKSKSKTYYSKTMKHEVRKKIKSCQANFIMKDLLEDESASSDEYLKNVLDRLHIAIESGEDIVVDSSEFWQVRQDKKTLGRRVTSLSYFLKLIFHFVFNFRK